MKKVIKDTYQTTVESGNYLSGGIDSLHSKTSELFQTLNDNEKSSYLAQKESSIESKELSEAAVHTHVNVKNPLM